MDCCVHISPQKLLITIPQRFDPNLGLSLCMLPTCCYYHYSSIEPPTKNAFYSLASQQANLLYKAPKIKPQTRSCDVCCGHRIIFSFISRGHRQEPIISYLHTATGHRINDIFLLSTFTKYDIIFSRNVCPKPQRTMQNLRCSRRLRPQVQTYLLECGRQGRTFL